MALEESERIERIAGFRRAADFMEAHPTVAPPMVVGAGELRWHLYSWDCPDGIPAMVAAIRRAVGGKWSKRTAESYGGAEEMVFERDGYTITTSREAVCVRRVVGTETVKVPARPAMEARPEGIETREIVEWDCEPVLAAEVAS